MEMTELRIERADRLRPCQPESLPASPRPSLAPLSGGGFALGPSMLDAVGESLCDAVDVRIGTKLLDVGGNDACSRIAARRGAELAEVTSRRVHDVGLALGPFTNDSLDVVMSAFGGMWRPDDVRAPSELLRICRHGGRIGIAHWVPYGFVGRVLALVETHAPAYLGWASPISWSVEDTIDRMFCPAVCDVLTTHRTVTFHHGSAEAWVDELRTTRGPVRAAFESVSHEGRRAFERELLYLIDDFNLCMNASVLVPSEYVEIVIVKK